MLAQSLVSPEGRTCQKRGSCEHLSTFKHWLPHWQDKASLCPLLSTGWAGNLGTYLWQLSVATADVLMENPKALTQGKPQEFMDHLTSPCICHADTAAYLCPLPPAASHRFVAATSITGLYQPVQSSASQWRFLKFPLRSIYLLTCTYLTCVYDQLGFLTKQINEFAPFIHLSMPTSLSICAAAYYLPSPKTFNPLRFFQVYLMKH